jgi:hypothetical protein
VVKLGQKQPITPPKPTLILKSSKITAWQSLPVIFTIAPPWQSLAHCSVADWCGINPAIVWQA